MFIFNELVFMFNEHDIDHTLYCDTKHLKKKLND